MSKSYFSPLPIGRLHFTVPIQKGRKNYHYSKRAVSKITSNCFSIFTAFSSHLQEFFMPKSQETLQWWKFQGHRVILKDLTTV